MDPVLWLPHLRVEPTGNSSPERKAARVPLNAVPVRTQRAPLYATRTVPFTQFSWLGLQEGVGWLLIFSHILRNPVCLDSESGLTPFNSDTQVVASLVWFRRGNEPAGAEKDVQVSAQWDGLWQEQGAARKSSVYWWPGS